MTVAPAELNALVRREHPNPHQVLGAHPTKRGVIVRALRPAASSVTAELDDGQQVELARIHPGGGFEGLLAGAALPMHYRLRVDYGSEGSFTIEDPYAFLPTLGEIDLHLIS